MGRDEEIGNKKMRFPQITQIGVDEEIGDKKKKL